MYNDVILTFWETRPKLIKFREEGAEADVDRCELDEATGLPVIEKLNRGIIKINLIDWLKKSPAKPSYSASQKKKADQGSSEAHDRDILH